MKRKIFFPPVGIAHITSDLSDLFKYRITDKELVVINTSAQPNSVPHLGTVTTIMVAFAVAELIRRKLNLNVLVQFDQLENAPAETIEINNVLYSKSLENSYINNETKLERNMKSFKEVLDMISSLSNVDYEIRSYRTFQQNIHLRKALTEILQNKDEFAQLLNPSKGTLHVRTECSKCKLVDKKCVHTNYNSNENCIIIESYCPIHGNYQVVFSVDNDTYLDVNTQLRDLLKGVVINKEDQANNCLTVMLDGGDWSGTWSQRIHCEGLMKLAHSQVPIRLFAPMILDWSGAKLSKSLYITDTSYFANSVAFTNWKDFNSTYGIKGIEILWNEVKNWADSPKKFFRNYSVDYLEELLEASN